MQWTSWRWVSTIFENLKSFANILEDFKYGFKKRQLFSVVKLRQRDIFSIIIPLNLLSFFNNYILQRF